MIRATPGDLDLARQAIVAVHGRALADDAALTEFLRDPANYLLLAVVYGQVVGSLNGYSLRSPASCARRFLLYEIDVRPEHRRSGIGTTLVNEFVRFARIEGACKVWVPTNRSNSAAVGLYKRYGFTSPNQDDVMLELSLAADHR